MVPLGTHKEQETLSCKRNQTLITPKGGQGQVRVRSVQMQERSTGKWKASMFQQIQNSSLWTQVQGGVMRTKGGFTTENLKD